LTEAQTHGFVGRQGMIDLWEKEKKEEADRASVVQVNGVNDGESKSILPMLPPSLPPSLAPTPLIPSSAPTPLPLSAASPPSLPTPSADTPLPTTSLASTSRIKTMELPTPMSVEATTPAAETPAVESPAAGEEDLDEKEEGDVGKGRDGKKGKKRRRPESTYWYLIESVPGRNAMQKDDFFTSLAQDPAWQHKPLQINQLSEQHLADVFTGWSKEGIPGMPKEWWYETLGDIEKKKRKKKRADSTLSSATGMTSVVSSPTSTIAGTPFTSAPTPKVDPTSLKSPMDASRAKLKKPVLKGVVGTPRREGSVQSPATSIGGTEPLDSILGLKKGKKRGPDSPMTGIQMKKRKET